MAMRAIFHLVERSTDDETFQEKSKVGGVFFIAANEGRKL